jgi:hypothetical protein
VIERGLRAVCDAEKNKANPKPQIVIRANRIFLNFNPILYPPSGFSKPFPEGGLGLGV